MGQGARSEVRAGRAPDFALPPWDERRQAFEALAYRALLQGDSSETMELRQRLDGAAAAPPAEPSAEALRWTRCARHPQRPRDTAAAVAAHERGLARRPPHMPPTTPHTGGAPPGCPRPRLGRATGDTAGSERWRNSFRHSWSVADLFYFAALDSLPPGSFLPRHRSIP